MGAKWVTIERGIRCREHPTNKHGIGPDRYFAIRYYDASGKQVEEALGWASEGVTLKSAREKLADLGAAKRAGKPSTIREQAEAERRAAEDEARQWAIEAAEEVRRNLTLETYFTDTYQPWAEATKAKAFAREEQIWRVWLRPTLGKLPINAIGMEQWDHLMKTLAAADLSERSREYTAGTLRRILKHARERRVVTEAPPTGKMVGATSPKDNRRLRVLSDEDLQGVLAALKARDLNAWRVTLFAAGTGCRASEAFTLRWGNVDLKACTATFPKTKNGRSRTVPLGKEILAMLADMTAGKPMDLVFPNQDGRAYRFAPSAFRDEAEKLNEGRDPRDRFTFHSLRHMAATRLATVLPLRALMDTLGWTVAAMALRYSHTSEGDRKAAAEALDAAFRPAAPKGKVVSFKGRRGA